MFEPALQGPKPNLPTKPSSKPAPPKRSDNTKLQNGGGDKQSSLKRSEDSKLNGDVQLTPINKFLPNKTGTMTSDKNKDENSNVKQNSGNVSLNSNIVSKFNSIRNKLEGPEIPFTKPPWQKPTNTCPKPTDTSPKPADTSPKLTETFPKPSDLKRPVGKLPLEGTLTSRVISFENTKKDDTSDNRQAPTKPIISNKVSGIADKIATISEKPKFPPKIDNKPPVTAKSESKPPGTPTKPVQSNKPKTFSTVSPTLPVSEDNEFLMKIKKRKESIDQMTTSEPKQQNNDTKGGSVTSNKTEDCEVQLRGKQRQVSVKHRKSITRVVDKKKFFLVEFSNSDTSTADKPPQKPQKLPHVDLDSIVSEYKKKFMSTDGKLVYESQMFFLKI